MPRMNDAGPELGAEARRVLAEALRALELERAQALIGDTTHCLSTDRTRRVAASAAAATVPEQRHARACERCSSRIRAFQQAKLTTSDRLLESNLQAARAAASVSPPWLVRVDGSARTFFERLRRAYGGDASAAEAWLLTDDLAQELRAARDAGAPPTVSEYLIAATLGAAEAVAHDVLSPFSSRFDAAWPMFELLRVTMREASLAGEAARHQFARGYARVVAGSPTYLRAILAGQIEALADGLPGAEEFVETVSREIAIRDSSAATHPLLAMPMVLRCGPMGADADSLIRPLVLEWRDAALELSRNEPAEEVENLVAARLHSFFERLLSKAADPVASLLQLHVIRRYLSDLMVSGHGEIVHRVAAEAVITYAAEPHSSVFLAVETCQSFASAPTLYAKVLSAMIAVGRSELRHGVAVALRRAYERQAGLGGRFEARYIRQGSGWGFACRAAQPLDEPARQLASLAAKHPDLAESLAWFNERSEPSTDTEPAFI